MDYKLPLISVVVPMHNAETYIQRCVESICKQKYENYEVILVDDHSSDNTLQLCKDLYYDDGIVIAYNNGKKGVSATRNIGIRLAKGDYITFVDSDDVIATEYLDVLYNLSIQHPNRLAMCNIVEFGEKTPNFSSVSEEGRVMCIETKRFLSNIYAIHPSACACLFKSEIIKKYNICFSEKCSFCEDDYFTSKYVALCDGVVSISSRLYGYYINYEGIGAHKDHSKLCAVDVNHRAESIIGMLDAVEFTNCYNKYVSQYIEYGYTFIAADVMLTSERAGVHDFKYKKEIRQYLSLKNCLYFTLWGINKKQVAFVNGVAMSSRVVKLILDMIYGMNFIKL